MFLCVPGRRAQGEVFGEGALNGMPFNFDHKQSLLDPRLHGSKDSHNASKGPPKKRQKLTDRQRSFTAAILRDPVDRVIG